MALIPERGSESRSGLGFPTATVAKPEAVAVTKPVAVAVARGDLVKRSTSRQVSLSIFLPSFDFNDYRRMPPVGVVESWTVSCVEPRSDSGEGRKIVEALERTVA
jgi:hypothetical protein